MLIYNILIVIFIFLISYQIYLEMTKQYLIEGMDTATTDSSTVVYKDYGSSDSATNALILAQQNAGNIEFLKQQIDSLLPLKAQVDNLNYEVETIPTQINDLAQQQADYATELAGSTPPQITGTDYTSTTDTTTTTTTTTPDNTTTTNI